MNGNEWGYVTSGGVGDDGVFSDAPIAWGEEVETIVYSPVDWDEEQRKQDDVWRRSRQQGYVDIVTGGGVVRAAVDTGDDG